MSHETFGFPKISCNQIDNSSFQVGHLPNKGYYYN